MKRSHKEDSRLYDLRCTICCAVLVLIAAIRPLHAQDILPGSLSCHAGGADCDTLCLYSQRTDTVSVPLITFPAAFRQMKENVLTDSLGILNPFWEKLRLSRLGASADTLRIVHVGDSHIRGHIFPRTTGALMQDTFGAVSYTDVGINGAFCTTFTRPDRIADIAALHPDLLILSFGTNESHNRRYNTMLHYRQMDDLVRMLREKLPNVPMLMTTPPALTRVSGSVAVVGPIRLIRVLPLPCRPSAAMPMKTDWRYGTCTKYLAVPTVLPQLAGSRIDGSGPCTLFAGRLPPARRAVLPGLVKSL